MTEFIEFIESIGFIEIDSSYENGYNTLNWSYNGYRISIINQSEHKKIWWRMSDDKSGGVFGFKILGVTKTYFLLDEIGLLEKHFKPELRELKLKELGL